MAKRLPATAIREAVALVDAADLPRAGIHHEVRIVLAGVRLSRAMRDAIRLHAAQWGPKIGREALSNSQRRASVPSR